MRRFTSKDAYVRHNGTAPLPVWSGNRIRHRLSRTGNRQISPRLHRSAITQAVRTTAPEPSFGADARTVTARPNRSVP